LFHYLFYTKKCNKLNVGGGGLSFLDEGGGVLKIKVLRLGAALKKFNICYLSPTASPPPPIINGRSLRNIHKTSLLFADKLFNFIVFEMKAVKIIQKNHTNHIFVISHNKSPFIISSKQN
jgi:hypothetical protein